MEKIGLLIDSTTLTRKDLLDYEFIKVAQLQVQVENETYRENELSKEQMENYVDEGKKFLTSQPSPTDFFELYKQYHEEGYTHVIAIIISHKLSGTYQSAMVAKSMIDFDLQVDIHSSLVASYGMAQGAKKLAESIKEGKSYNEVTKKYNVLFKEPLVAFTLGNLKNLIRGGRLSRVQGFVGKIMRIKPVIEMINGKLELVRKERTIAGCSKFFMTKLDYYCNKYKKVYLEVVNIHMDDIAAQFISKVKEKYKDIEIHITDFLSPVFYSHLGTKGFGIGVMAE